MSSSQKTPSTKPPAAATLDTETLLRTAAAIATIIPLCEESPLKGSRFADRKRPTAPRVAQTTSSATTPRATAAASTFSKVPRVSTDITSPGSAQQQQQQQTLSQADGGGSGSNSSNCDLCKGFLSNTDVRSCRVCSKTVCEECHRFSLQSSGYCKLCGDKYVACSSKTPTKIKKAFWNDAMGVYCSSECMAHAGVCFYECGKCKLAGCSHCLVPGPGKVGKPGSASDALVPTAGMPEGATYARRAMGITQCLLCAE